MDVHRYRSSTDFLFIFTEKQRRNFHVTTTVGIILGTTLSVLFVVCVIASAFKMRCCKTLSNSKRSNKIRTSNGNLHVIESDKTFASPVHNEDGSGAASIDYGIDADDKNPDIIPQPIAG